jgi:FkbM family methyltransferase
VAAAIEHEAIIRSLEFRALIDIGANVGQFSLLARSLNNDLVIYAFEPLPAAAERFGKLFGSDPRVRLYLVAAGERAGTTDINISGRSHSSSLLPITKSQIDAFPGTARIAVAKVDVSTVDTLLANAVIPDPILIKLDVQGYELAALNGMRDLLSRAKYVYCEVSFREFYRGQPLAHEIIEWLAARGFRVVGIGHVQSARGGMFVQADLLFERLT